MSFIRSGRARPLVIRQLKPAGTMYLVRPISTLLSQLYSPQIKNYTLALLDLLHLVLPRSARTRPVLQPAIRNI
jgi:hypothetical protein